MTNIFLPISNDLQFAVFKVEYILLWRAANKGRFFLQAPVNCSSQRKRFALNIPLKGLKLGIVPSYATLDTKYPSLSSRSILNRNEVATDIKRQIPVSNFPLEANIFRECLLSFSNIICTSSYWETFLIFILHIDRNILSASFLLNASCFLL